MRKMEAQHVRKKNVIVIMCLNKYKIRHILFVGECVVVRHLKKNNKNKQKRGKKRFHILFGASSLFCCLFLLYSQFSCRFVVKQFLLLSVIRFGVAFGDCFGVERCFGCTMLYACVVRIQKNMANQPTVRDYYV